VFPAFQCHRPFVPCLRGLQRSAVVCVVVGTAGAMLSCSSFLFVVCRVPLCHLKFWNLVFVGFVSHCGALLFLIRFMLAHCDSMRLLISSLIVTRVEMVTSMSFQ